VKVVAISQANPVLPPYGPGRIEPTKPTVGKPAPQPVGKPFGEVLRQKVVSTEEVVFSAHARDRLVQRNIQLTPNDMDRLRGGLHQAEAKGAKESLVLMNEMAFVVSVPNRTVITAMTGDSIKGNVFTQIDSAVIV
jgi:flagellar operon protein